MAQTETGATEDSMTWPRKADEARLQRYNTYFQLYDGEHYDAFSIIGEKGFTQQYSRLRYIVANFPQLMTDVIADMLFGEKITIEVDDTNQDFIDNLMEENELLTQLHESATANSYNGDSVFKIRIGKRDDEVADSKPTIIIEEISPSIYFPVLDQTSGRYKPKQQVVAWTFEQDNKTYLHKEIHTTGKIQHEIWEYDPKQKKLISQMAATDFGFQDTEDTKVDKPLVFHIPNTRAGNFFGRSDYKGMISLFFALNNRITKIDNVLDKHGDPILAVPPGVFDEEGNVRVGSLKMYEVDSDNPGFNKPEYIVWDANLEAAFKQIDKLVEFLFMFSQIAPASMGLDKEGQAESGRALKFKLLSTIRKSNQKRSYYDQAIKDMIETAQNLAIAHKISVGGETITKAFRPTIGWGDGVINDETEMIDNAIKRVDAALSSRADEIAKLDDITPEEARKKVEEIDKENSPALSANNPLLALSKTPQDANNGDLNGQNIKNGAKDTSAISKQPAVPGKASKKPVTAGK